MDLVEAQHRGSPLELPVTELQGVGPERAKLLARLEIRTIEDLLLHAPRRYEDRRHFRPIVELKLKEPAMARGTIVALGVKYYRNRARSIFEFVLDDGTARLHCRWWNLPFMEKYFAKGDEVVVFGKPLSLKPRVMDHPETEVVEAGEERSIHLNRIAPIYPATEGLTQNWLRALIYRTLERYAGGITEPHPTLGLAANAWPSRRQAIENLHFPQEEPQAERGRRRLALDEFIELQYRIQKRRRNFQEKAKALPCKGDNRLMKPFLAGLQYRLTDAQTRVLRELRADMSGQHPMRRLLQGDVGSGKTVVAGCCTLMAIESGYSVALMAPTEILAEQHFQNFSRWFKPLGVGVELHTGTYKTNQPAPNGHPVVSIGTHALLHSGYASGNLGLVIIDEQHKFGVAQREELLRKGRYPHLLVMTATPIPRTLALTLYGDLNISVIDEIPPGRGRIRTFVRTADQLDKVWSFVGEQLRAGRQLYVVCPKIDDTAPNGAKAVMKEFEVVSRALEPCRVAALHGRVPPEEKERLMGAFRANLVQALVATSLIEVGVDIPNATIMIIEDAELFGLAQMHQLRGRIGRGAHDSYCILVVGKDTPEARARLRVLEETQDGFKIAEADLQLRGPGELVGREQSGVPRLRFGDLRTDLELVHLARKFAAQLVPDG